MNATIQNIKDLMNSRTGKSWLFTQNNSDYGRENFHPDQNTPNRFWNGDWTGLPKKTDYIAHWIVKERTLYLGKTSLMPPVAVPKSATGDRQRYKLIMDFVDIYQFEIEEVTGSFLKNLLQAQPGTVYTYWPKGDHQSLHQWQVDTKTGKIFAKRDQLETISDSFEARVTEAMNLSLSELETNAHRYPLLPEKTEVKTSVFKRNPYVVALALIRANGICECCGNNAPFVRINGMPYLEVHHIHKLAEGGADCVENTQALCPNCHREKHFG